MEHSGYIAALRADGDAFARVVPADIDVPTCPGWTLIDLYHHTGSVHRWQLAQLADGDPSELRPAPKVELPTDPDDLVDWLLEGVDDLAVRLTEVGPDRLAPSWFGPRPAVFWSRRAAHETAMHRFDAQASVASPSPIDTALASDGIDELLEISAPRRLRQDPWPDPPVTVHLHATDGDGDGEGTNGEWMLSIAGQQLTVEHTHGKGDVAVRASASDLLLVLAGRLPLARTETFGDTAVMDRWYATVKL